MARVFVVHKWHGTPDDDWYGWIGGELSKRGHEVHIPEMPDTDNPTVAAWVSCLAREVGTPDSNTYLVGHSIGCQTILRYLESLDGSVKIGGVLLVGAWMTLNLEALDPGEPKIARKWMSTPLRWQIIKGRARQFTVIQSENDPYVPLENTDLFRRMLDARVLIQPRAGHFEKGDGFDELHVGLNELLKMMK